MIRYLDYKNIPDFKECAACIGYFDGIHLGHQRLIRKTVQLAKEKGLKSALITFYPDPWVVLKGMKNVAHLTSMEDREQIANNLGIDEIYCFEFTREFAELEIEDFIKDVLIALNVKELVCGFDFTFGRFGKGTCHELLLHKEFNTYVVESINHNGEKISSTRIEKELNNGNIKSVSELLGRPYWINGIVKEGRKIGRTINFPTANLETQINYVLPKNGVYYTIVEFDDKLIPSLTNIGNNSKFNRYENISIETNLIDFNNVLYGRTLRIYFVDYLRDEIEFESIDILKEQLMKDKEAAKYYFSKYYDDMVSLIKEDSNYAKEILITK